jgi:Putative metallopeptidase
MAAARLVVIAISILLSVTPLDAAPDTRAQRILFEYEKPKNPAHQSLYERLKERRVLEKLQDFFSPFQLPIDLTFKTIGCDGRANAWYQRPSVTLCYEYLDELRKGLPTEAAPTGISAEDAMVGQFFYVVAHEFGHAIFDLLNVPSFGGAEDAADQFSTYLMLNFGKEEARRLIGGAAYSYRDAVQSSTVILPLQAFSEVHGVPAQRFFNLLCVAYGADPQLFADVVQYLPKQRAADCNREYQQIAFAFQQLIMPHVDPTLAKQVMQKAWLPEATRPR